MYTANSIVKKMISIEDFVPSAKIEKDMDHNVHTFTVSADGHEFKCIPAQTSNFDVFRLSNKHLTDNEAKTIWDYYRELFIRAKLTGQQLSHYRKGLSNFVAGKKLLNTDEFGFSNQQVDLSTRNEQIKRMIGLSLWLELQYRVDTTVDQLSENISTVTMINKSQRILEPAVYNNYISYFSKSKTFTHDPEVYTTRKLYVKNVFDYTHKNYHHYICKSEFGATEVKIDRKHSPFIVNFSKQINEGVEINVVSAEIKTNIDNTVPTLVIRNFFIE